MATISDLSEDLVEEILSRVPLKFMRSVRQTCKKWNNISKNRSFLKEEESQMIVMKSEKLYLMSFVINEDPYIELKGKFTCLTQEQQLQVLNVFNCEGLLLCIFKDDHNKKTKLMIWNPYCLQPKWIEPRCSYNGLLGIYLCFYGLGYEDKSCGRSYKILRFIDVSLFIYATEQEQFSWYEIYDIESESWKTLDITPLWSIWFRGFGINVKGNTYWCVVKTTDLNGDYHVICFDFTKERFGSLMHLPFYAMINANQVVLSGVGEEKLVALVQNSRPKANGFEIWITTEIEDFEKLTWSKFLKVNMEPEIACTVESIIVDEEKKLVIGYGDNDKIIIFGEFGYVKELYVFEEAGLYLRRCLCAYVPSLVQIKQAARGKRKKRDNAERSRCDEKMLKLNAYEKELMKLHRRQKEYEKQRRMEFMKLSRRE